MAPYTDTLRARVGGEFVMNPQVSLLLDPPNGAPRHEARLHSRQLELFETIPQALRTLVAELDRDASIDPLIAGVFCSMDRLARYHTVDFVYSARSKAVAGPGFRLNGTGAEPGEHQRWIIESRPGAPDAGIFRNHASLSPVSDRPYYTRLRPFVGTDWLSIVGSGTFVQNAEGQILLHRRADNGRWSTPGGCLEIGESIEETAVRETAEETGWRVRLEGLAGIRSEPECAGVYPNGDKQRYIGVFFHAAIVGGEAVPRNEETLELGWFDPEKLPPDTASDTRRHVADMMVQGNRGDVYLPDLSG